MTQPVLCGSTEQPYEKSHSFLMQLTLALEAPPSGRQVGSLPLYCLCSHFGAPSAAPDRFIWANLGMGNKITGPKMPQRAEFVTNIQEVDEIRPISYLVKCCCSSSKQLLPPLSFAPAQ